jgi:hypothetical protein
MYFHVEYVILCCRQWLPMLLQGWLNIDFASEVRLEKKLGEGGFGQVGRTGTRHEPRSCWQVLPMQLTQLD